LVHLTDDSVAGSKERIGDQIAHFLFAVESSAKRWIPIIVHVILWAQVVTPTKRRQKKLKLSHDTVETYYAVPVRWLKQVIALFLVPPAWVLTRAFFSSFSIATVHHSFWVSEEFWFFSLGALLWTIAFLGLPRPMLMYVLGHELTHAIWVWLMGGRVSKFKVSREGGYIVTDTTNFWIALAPYFFPLYSILALLLYGGIGVFTDVDPYRRWLFGVVGFTFAFHVTFTILMLWKGQSDLIDHGTFFSMMVIYLANFSLLSLMLIIACHEVTFASFGNELLQGAMEFSDWVLRLAHVKR
jgi:hypothetical protein